MINQIKYGKGLWVGVTVMGSVGVGGLNVEVSRRTGNKCTSTHVTKSGQVSLLVSAVTIHLCIYVLIENYNHHTEYKIGIAADTKLQDVCSKYYSVLKMLGNYFPQIILSAIFWDYLYEIRSLLLALNKSLPS